MDKNFRSCFCCVHFLVIQNTSIGNKIKDKGNWPHEYLRKRKM